MLGTLWCRSRAGRKVLTGFTVSLNVLIDVSASSDQTGLRQEEMCVLGSVCDQVSDGFSHRTLEQILKEPEAPSAGKITHC